MLDKTITHKINQMFELQYQNQFVKFQATVHVVSR